MNIPIVPSLVSVHIGYIFLLVDRHSWQFLTTRCALTLSSQCQRKLDKRKSVFFWWLKQYWFSYLTRYISFINFYFNILVWYCLTFHENKQPFIFWTFVIFSFLWNFSEKYFQRKIPIPNDLIRRISIF